MNQENTFKIICFFVVLVIFLVSSPGDERVHIRHRCSGSLSLCVRRRDPLTLPVTVLTHFIYPPPSSIFPRSDAVFWHG